MTDQTNSQYSPTFYYCTVIIISFLKNKIVITDLHSNKFLIPWISLLPMHWSMPQERDPGRG